MKKAILKVLLETTEKKSIYSGGFGEEQSAIIFSDSDSDKEVFLSNIADGIFEGVKAEVIKLLKEMRPTEADLPEFDQSRKQDHIYCIEYGMKKQRHIEKAVYDRQISELLNTK